MLSRLRAAGDVELEWVPYSPFLDLPQLLRNPVRIRFLPVVPILLFVSRLTPP
jgi:hypothetical protein